MISNSKYIRQVCNQHHRHQRNKVEAVGGGISAAERIHEFRRRPHPLRSQSTYLTVALQLIDRLFSPVSRLKSRSPFFRSSHFFPVLFSIRSLAP